MACAGRLSITRALCVIEKDAIAMTRLGAGAPDSISPSSREGDGVAVGGELGADPARFADRRAIVSART